MCLKKRNINQHFRNTICISYANTGQTWLSGVYLHVEWMPRRTTKRGLSRDANSWILLWSHDRSCRTLALTCPLINIMPIQWASVWRSLLDTCSLRKPLEGILRRRIYQEVYTFFVSLEQPSILYTICCWPVRGSPLIKAFWTEQDGQLQGNSLNNRTVLDGLMECFRLMAIPSVGLWVLHAGRVLTRLYLNHRTH
jgi:hypothetical protein